MAGRWPFVAEKIASRIALIAPHIHRRSVALPPFRLLPLPGPMVDAPICHDPTGWDEVPHESYWGHADLNFVMKSRFTVPEGWTAENVALHLPLGVLGDIFNHPEALVHVDRVPIGSADRYHHTIAMDAKMADGREHVLSLHGWTGLAGWPPDPACRAKLFMGRPALVERDPALAAFHDLANATLDTARHLPAESPEARGLLAALDAAFVQLDTRAPMGEALYRTVPEAMKALEEGIAAAGEPLDVTLHGIGHAHMDIAYLWTIDQIRLKNARTYSNVLRLMDRDADFRFSHSQPQLYAMTARDYPRLFERIRRRVSEGRWEVMGGMWVEPDLNIPGGEALIRQLTLGRGWFAEQFGEVETPVLWLPDTFGFPGQVPQLMKLAGLDWFVTNKLNWNQLNRVPSSTHRWEGIDGSEVLAHVLTTPRDVQYLPFPTNYKSDLSAAEVHGTWSRSTAQDTVRDLPVCYGYGDGGGGPTEDLLAKGRAYRDMPGMPRFRPSSVRDFFGRIEPQRGELPVWRGEHYMEGHRGVLTSQGWIKRANRKAEWALHEAEAMAAMGGLTCELREAWELLCLNQFHDIITGTSIPAVFEDARRDFDRLRTMVEAEAARAAENLSGPTMRVVNTSPVKGSRLALLPDESGTQTVEGGSLALFADMPPYACVPIGKAEPPALAVTVREVASGFILENATSRVTLDRKGQILSLFDHGTNREVLAEGSLGNALIAFEDRPICWDAWDIDPSYEDRAERVEGATIAQIVEHGPMRVAVRFETRWRSSIICQTIRLAAHSDRLDFVTEIDWHEQHTLLKAAFPTAIHCPYAEFDIQWGRIRRSTTRDTDFDAARFEVPAQKWARLTDGVRSVAVLNDCKYGYDVTGDTIRITLIKSSTSPDPGADQGRHEFTYALLAEDLSYRDRLLAEAYDLNAPLRVLPAADDGPERPSLVTSDTAGIVVETLKPAEDGDGVILRLFEPAGLQAAGTLTFGEKVASAHDTSIFEQDGTALEMGDHTLAVRLTPFEIRTLRIRFRR